MIVEMGYGTPPHDEWRVAGLAKIVGLAGLRPGESWVSAVTCPPFDVIKPASPLETFLRGNPNSLFHVTLGENPADALRRLIAEGILVEDPEPGFYVYEQCYGDHCRIGFLAAPEVRPYETGDIIRHEKTFDEKVNGRIRLMEETGYVTEPIWLLTRTPIDGVLEKICASEKPIYDFCSDFGGESELSGITNRVFKVAEDSVHGRQIMDTIMPGPLYIADGHHRYHSALRMGLDRCIAYICQIDKAGIQAYNRLIHGRRSFGSVRDNLSAVRADAFATPPRHSFSIYTRDGVWQYGVGDVDESDPVRRLDCSILETTMYPLLGLDHAMIMDERFFDYHPEQDLDKAKEAVDSGAYDLAVALHPVSPEELVAVADAGVGDPDIVMPEKSTFFAPKILSGLILIPTCRAGQQNVKAEVEGA